MRTPLCRRASRRRHARGASIAVAIGALALAACGGDGPSVRADPPTSTSSSTSSPLTTSTTGTGTATAAGRVVRLGNLELTVPAAWPVYDLAADPTTCVRVDQHAVYVGRPGANQQCPAQPVGHTEAVLVERLADAGTNGSAAATQSGTINGLPVRVDPTPDIDGALTAVFVDQGVLVYLSFGTDRATVDAILASAQAVP
jgi:hypothetical protein